MVRIRIEERDEWTDEDKTERRKWWRNRTLRDMWRYRSKIDPGSGNCVFGPCPYDTPVSGAHIYMATKKESRPNIRRPSAINTTCRTIAFWFIAVPWLRPQVSSAFPASCSLHPFGRGLVQELLHFLRLCLYCQRQQGKIPSNLWGCWDDEAWVCH